MKRQPHTVIVDTRVLSDGLMRLIEFRPFGETTIDECHSVTVRALASATSHLAENLREALNIDTAEIKHPPVAHYQSGIHRTLWHHGEKFASYCLGTVEQIVELCDLTDNERELLARLEGRLNGEGKLTFGLAQGQTSSAVTKTSDYASSLKYVGTIICEPVLISSTIGMAEQLREQGTRIVYLSRDARSTVAAVANAAHIDTEAGVYSLKGHVHMHEDAMTIVADIPARQYKDYVARYPGAHVIQHELSELR
jgi:cation transport ATPase